MFDCKSQGRWQMLEADDRCQRHAKVHLHLTLVPFFSVSFHLHFTLCS